MKKQFGFTITNNDSQDRVIALFPGNLDTITHVVTQSGTSPYAVTEVKHAHTSKDALNAYGIPVDAALDDGTLMPNVTATSRNPKNKIRHFIKYVQFNPMVLTKLSVKGSNADVFNQSLFVMPDSPVHGTATQEIPLTAAVNLYQVQDNRAELTPNIPIFDETIAWITIPAGRTVSFDMEFGDFNPWK
jgi:hypothetical protein